MTRESFAGGVATAVDLVGVERQLRHLWELAGPTVTRASLFNFIAVCGSADQRERATRVVSELTVRHPCRAILLTTQPEAAHAELAASVTALCHLAGGGRKQVCCELIQLTAAGPGIARVGSAVLPLLESDLPTVVWYLGDLSGAGRNQLVALNGVTDRLIFDGACCASTAALRSVHELVQTQRRIRFADLAWTRLSLWRKLLADCFDDPHAVAALGAMQRLHIVYGGGQGARWRALLFAGWVAAQLDWDAAQLVQWLQLECREDADTKPLGLLSVELSGARARVQVRKNFGEYTATAQVSMPHVCGLPRRQAFAAPEEARLLSQELDQAGGHPVYEAALALAAELSWRST